MTFEHFGFKNKILQALENIGFDSPMPVQGRVIPTILDGQFDLVCLAQTGTGKTAAFGLPMVNEIDFNKKKTQGVVICPTRELCVQVAKDFKSYSSYITKLGIVALYGGASIIKQIYQIKNGAQIIVATPGRLLDLIKRKEVNLSSVKYVVLDEADEMLSMGFREDVNSILSLVPLDRIMCFFSATMPYEVKKLVKKYMKDPIEVNIGIPNHGVSGIKHLKYVLQDKFRYEALKRIIYYHPKMFGLVFCRTRRETQQVVDNLIRDKVNAGALHGELSQNQRDIVMSRFRAGELKVLVATDVAARGIDINDISHVIHYNIPDKVESYTHRSGRTGRAGRSGVSIVLVNNLEHRKLTNIAKKTGAKFIKKDLPVRSDVIQKQAHNIIASMLSTENDSCHERFDAFLPSLCDMLSSLSREELIKKFVLAQVSTFLNFDDRITDISRWSINNTEGKTGVYRKRRNEYLKSSTARFSINIGSNNKINKGAITRLICDRSGINSNQIGKIDINKSQSYFEMEKDVSEFVLRSMKGARLDGYSVKILNIKQKISLKTLSFKDIQKNKSIA